MQGAGLPPPTRAPSTRSALPRAGLPRETASRRSRSCPMPSHQFDVGESVTLEPSISRNVPGGVYEVTRQLPHNGREFQYRIKSVNEQHERVAGEGELTKV